MNTQLALSKSIFYPGTTEAIEFKAVLSEGGVRVEASGPFVPRIVDWDKIEDVEFLADHFWDAQVWEFREIIKLLVQAKPMQAMFA